MTADSRFYVSCPLSFYLSQMLALAGAIGSGLFLSSGFSLERAGPVGMLLVSSASKKVVRRAEEVSSPLPLSSNSRIWLSLPSSFL